MGKVQSFTIGDKFFNSKTELVSFIKSILHESEIDQPISQKNFLFLKELIERHPDQTEKVGSGIKDIIVLVENVYKKKCFWIIRTDDTRTDFSYKSCIRNNWDNEPMEMFREAARRAVDPQIAFYREDYIKRHKDANGNFPCEKTRAILKRKEENVDHKSPYTFDTIVKNFLSFSQIDLLSIQYIGFGDGEIVKEFKDEDLKRQFADYHREIATLQVICKTENLKQPKR